MNFQQILWRAVFILAVLWGGTGSGRKPDGHPPVPAKEEGRVRVKDFAKEYGFREVKVRKDHVWLKGQVHSMKLFKDSRRCELNGSLVWLNDGMAVRNRWWTLSSVDVEKTLRPVVRPVDALGGAGHRVVVLDPGHGGKDSGAVSATGLQEKAVVLDITRQVRAHLLKAGYQVYTTRHNDSFIELAERARRAKSWKADLFVSIHANAGSKSARGTETYVLSLPGYRSTNQKPGTDVSAESVAGNEHDAANMALGYAMHHAMRKGTGLNDRGVRRARFLVLREAPCPAALVEVGFLSHKKEGSELARPGKRAEIAAALALGIENYLRGVKKAVVMAEPSTQKDES